MRALLAEEEANLQQERDRERIRQREIYKQSIQQKVERSWIRPPELNSDQSCTVTVVQVQGGDVVQVNADGCLDPIFRRSVESAVYRASPLPTPPDPSLFSREVQFIFSSRNQR
jgi:colicin import membrane protein